MKPKKPRILLLDAQRSTRQALSRHLDAAGYPVCTVSTGTDALVVCDIDPPDILIMDTQLPDMDGFELCERVRHETRDRDLTLIIATEASDEMTRAYLGQMVDFVGGDYFFAKPCDANLMTQLIDDLANEMHGKRMASRGGFPTRVVWPTSRAPVSASIC